MNIFFEIRQPKVLEDHISLGIILSWQTYSNSVLHTVLKISSTYLKIRLI